ncbi:MarR family transcriptional regulator [Paenibacillus sp. CAA11]|uniref:MarR family winged helix-turn-helix transcriptional regulator n=1 Tax=Paenibacillus sp. CAA11 TaxID=1532905 RepID=UPI000D3D5425|nr:MarR family transcriptional regulator [Paenibacillus sp. CAA11]AWB43581.1 MarR family transcriptional regulator [Paenibacillus sp. CAA11]
MNQEQDHSEAALSHSDVRLGTLIWFRLSRFYNQSIRRTSQHLKQWELSAAQFDALNQIGANKRLTQQELADKLLVTKGNITQLLSRMEELGWVRRDQEWKTKYVSLTPQGQELLASCAPQQEQLQAEQFSALSREEKKQLLALLRKIQ